MPSRTRRARTRCLRSRRARTRQAHPHGDGSLAGRVVRAGRGGVQGGAWGREVGAAGWVEVAPWRGTDADGIVCVQIVRRATRCTSITGGAGSLRAPRRHRALALGLARGRTLFMIVCVVRWRARVGRLSAACVRSRAWMMSCVCWCSLVCSCVVARVPWTPHAYVLHAMHAAWAHAPPRWPGGAGPH